MSDNTSSHSSNEQAQSPDTFLAEHTVEDVGDFAEREIIVVSNIGENDGFDNSQQRENNANNLSPRSLSQPNLNQANAPLMQDHSNVDMFNNSIISGVDKTQETKDSFSNNYDITEIFERLCKLNVNQSDELCNKVANPQQEKNNILDELEVGLDPRQHEVNIVYELLSGLTYEQADEIIKRQKEILDQQQLRLAEQKTKKIPKLKKI